VGPLVDSLVSPSEYLLQLATAARSLRHDIVRAGATEQKEEDSSDSDSADADVCWDTIGDHCTCAAAGLRLAELQVCPFPAISGSIVPPTGGFGAAWASFPSVDVRRDKSFPLQGQDRLSLPASSGGSAVAAAGGEACLGTQDVFHLSMMGEDLWAMQAATKARSVLHRCWHDAVLPMAARAFIAAA